MVKYYYHTIFFGAQDITWKITWNKELCGLSRLDGDHYHEAQKPQAPLKDQPPLLQTIVRELEAYLAGTIKEFTVPLRPKGTEYQQRVWAVLRTIPYGSTISYKELSDKLQSSPRAVAQALKKNPILLAIPCHRVIEQSGKIGGYSGGILLKYELLAHERDQIDI